MNDLRYLRFQDERTQLRFKVLTFLPVNCSITGKLLAFLTVFTDFLLISLIFTDFSDYTEKLIQFWRKMSGSNSCKMSSCLSQVYGTLGGSYVIFCRLGKEDIRNACEYSFRNIGSFIEIDRQWIDKDSKERMEQSRSSNVTAVRWLS